MSCLYLIISSYPDTVLLACLWITNIGTCPTRISAACSWKTSLSGLITRSRWLPLIVPAWECSVPKWPSGLCREVSWPVISQQSPRFWHGGIKQNLDDAKSCLCNTAVCISIYTYSKVGWNAFSVQFNWKYFNFHILDGEIKVCLPFIFNVSKERKKIKTIIKFLSWRRL